jgi:soluble lytic murein transglycosylase
MVRWLLAVWSLCNTALASASVAGGDEALRLRQAEAIYSLRHAEPAQALRLLQPLLADPNVLEPKERAEVRFVAAEAAFGVGDSNQALACLSGLEQALPEVGDYVWMWRGRCLRRSFAWQEAGAAYRALLKSYPTSLLRHEAAFGLADAHYARGEQQAALGAYQRALLLHDTGHQATHRALIGRLNLGTLQAARGQRRKAIRTFNELIRKDSRGDVARMAQAALRSLRAPQASAQANLKLALAEIDSLLQKQRSDLAAAAIEAAQPLAQGAPQLDALQARRAQLCMRRRDYPTAIALWTPLVSRSHGALHIEYARALATALAQAHQGLAAVLIFDDLAKHAPNSHDSREARFRAAWLTYNGGDFAGANQRFADFVRAFPRDPQVSEATWYLAWTAYKGGKYEEALASFAKLARRQLAKSPEGRLDYWRGQTHKQLGEIALAKQSFARAARSPMSYYGQLAVQRQTELGETSQSFASFPDAPDIADVSGAAADGAAAAGSPLQAAAPFAPLPQLQGGSGGSPLPWGTALEWSGKPGQRIRELLRLGMVRQAAKLIPHLPAARPGAKEVAYSRAALLQSLGDDAGLYRLASVAFASDLRGPLTGQARRSFMLAYPRSHATEVRRAVEDFGVPPELVLAVMRQESGFDESASSWASARGLMQVILPTARQIAKQLNMHDFAANQLEDPATNIRFGTWYLAKLLQEFDGNVLPAVASYNAGPSAVKQWLQDHGSAAGDEFVEDIPFRETRDYVKHVVANYAVYSQLWSNRPHRLPVRVNAHWRGAIDY